MILNENLISLKVDATSAEEVVWLLCNDMIREGFVGENYYKDVIEREKSFPTGLPTETMMVAIPHAAGSNIYESALAIAQLNKPVIFKSMGNPNEELMVSMVFLMAIKDPKQHLDCLRSLISMFQSEKTMINLKDAKTKKDIVNVFASSGFELSK